MKIRGPLFFSIFTLIILAAAYNPISTGAEKETVLMKLILRSLDQAHFNPKSVDDSFSDHVFDLYLERLDGSQRFLIKDDVDALTAFKSKIDDEALEGNYEFFDLSVEKIEAGIAKVAGFYKGLLEEPFDLDIDETIELDGKKRDYANNDAELKEFWRKYLKYEVLSRVHDKLEEQEKKGEEEEKLSVAQLEEDARADVLKMIDGWFNRLNKLDRSDRLSLYLNSFTNVYDPHTSYFKPIDKQNFDISMSGKLKGIGARLVNDGDYTKVLEIIVGGPAWKGKELEENDLIIKVKQANEEDPVDITGMVLDDVVQLIRGKPGTFVTLSVKKVDGSVKDITIERDVVIIEEGFAKSLILDGATEGERVGYIYLPRFYADFQDRNGRSCSKDVAAEITKLKEEKVDGIILDLRNNGGGSLRDVVKMSGFFIEDGPIVQVKSRGEKPEVLSDVDTRVQYDGSFIVMVNSFSASASEILAAAMQDYGRAIIVGSNSTFGKGTVQRFFDLDRWIRGFDEIKPLGEIKLTMQKFYRINGGSTQLKGVVPDIILPDNYHYIDVGEKEHEYPMEWTQIDPVPYDQKVARIRNLDNIKAKSEMRVNADATFQKVLANAQRLKDRQDDTQYPLSLTTYTNFMEMQEAEAAKYKDITNSVVNEGVFNLEIDLPSIFEDESKKARNEDWIKRVQKDIYIKETLNIMHDLIATK